MTRPEPVRFGRTAPTMAYPDGRLLAMREGRLYVLAVDGWSAAAGSGRPGGTTWLVRTEAEQWCDRRGIDTHLLDQVPAP
jgi:hypothetical protein